MKCVGAAANTECAAGTSPIRRLAICAARAIAARDENPASPDRRPYAAAVRSRARHRRRRRAVGRGRGALGRHHRRLARQFLHRGRDCAETGADGGALRAARRGLQDRRIRRRTGSRHCRMSKRVAIHPGFNMQAMSGHRATADVALLQLGAPARGKTPSVLGLPNIPIIVGSRFTIAGIGVTVRGDGKSGGTIRVAGLVATGKPGTLADPSGRSRGPGHARRARGLYGRFRRAGVRGQGKRPRNRRCRELVDRAERFAQAAAA